MGFLCQAARLGFSSDFPVKAVTGELPFQQYGAPCETARAEIFSHIVGVWILGQNKPGRVTREIQTFQDIDFSSFNIEKQQIQFLNTVSVQYGTKETLNKTTFSSFLGTGADPGS